MKKTKQSGGEGCKYCGAFLGNFGEIRNHECNEMRAARTGAVDFMESATPKVKTREQIGDELAQEVQKAVDKYPEYILTPKGYENLGKLARQWFDMREEE